MSNSIIQTKIRQTLQEIAWYENIFIDSNVWYNIPFTLCLDTFVELLPNSVFNNAITRLQIITEM